MSEYKPIPVNVAEEIAKKYDKSQVIINCIDNKHNMVHTTTFGVSEQDKLEAAELGEKTTQTVGGFLELAHVYEDFRNPIRILEDFCNFLGEQMEVMGFQSVSEVQVSLTALLRLFLHKRKVGKNEANIPQS